MDVALWRPPTRGPTWPIKKPGVPQQKTWFLYVKTFVFHGLLRAPGTFFLWHSRARGRTPDLPGRQGWDHFGLLSTGFYLAEAG